MFPVLVVVGSQPCYCSYDEMAPEVSTLVALPAKICTTCLGRIDGDMVDRYNQVHGYSGYDEYNEEPKVEADCE